MSDQPWSAKDATPDTTVHPDKEDRAWQAIRNNQPRLRFRIFLKDDTELQIPYLDLLLTAYASGQLTLYCQHCTIRMHGRLLKELRGLLAEDKLAAVYERHKSEFEQDERKPYIHKIEIDRPDLEAIGRKPEE